jgi:hypothetical protein
VLHHHTLKAARKNTQHYYITSGLLQTSISMAPTTRVATPRLTVSHVVALVEFWTLVAEHSGVAGAWRLTGGCKAAREGAKVWLRTLPGLVVCGGYTGTVVEEKMTSEVWRLDLGELRWERMSSLTCGRADHACCAVRGGVVVLGGDVEAEDDESERDEEEEPQQLEQLTASVEIFGFYSSETEESNRPSASVVRPHEQLRCGRDRGQSELGQVLLIGGRKEDGTPSSAVHKVDLAIGVCTPQPPLLFQRACLACRGLFGCALARRARRCRREELQW